MSAPTLTFIAAHPEPPGDAQHGNDPSIVATFRTDTASIPQLTQLGLPGDARIKHQHDGTWHLRLAVESDGWDALNDGRPRLRPGSALPRR